MLEESSGKGLFGIEPSEWEALKHGIRRALIYSVVSNVKLLSPDLKVSLARNIISDFYHSLNRKLILTNEETEKELAKAYALLSEEL